MNYRWKFSALLLFVSFNYCYNQSYIYAPRSVDAQYEKSRRIDVIINFTNPSDSGIRTVKELYVEYTKAGIDTKIATGNKNSFKEVATGTHFAGRVTTLFNSSAMLYSFILNDVKYDDDMELKYIFLYYNGNNVLLDSSKRTKINVTGGPTLCGKRLQSKYTFDMNSPAPIPLEICGNIRPTLFVKFGTHDEFTVQNVTAVPGKHHQYLYHIQLSNLKTSDCNSILRYRATGEGPEIEGGPTTIDLKFEISISNITSVRNGLCLTTTWDHFSTGNCPKVVYHVKYYLSGGNMTNINVSSITDNHHSYCASHLQHVEDITKVTVQAAYQQMTTQIYDNNVTDITPTTTTTTTTTKTPRLPNNGTVIGDDSEGEDIVLIISLSVGLGVLIVIIVFILIFCVYRKKSKSFKVYRDKVNHHQKHSIHEYPHKTSNPMYAVDTGHTNVNVGSMHIDRQPYIEKSPAHSDTTKVKIADAELKFYDPQEFDITPQNGYTFAPNDKQSPPGSPARPPPSRVEIDNFSYQHDEEDAVTLPSSGNQPELV